MIDGISEIIVLPCHPDLLRIDERRGRFLYDFLISPLDGAVSLVQVDGIPVLVRHDLDEHETNEAGVSNL